MEGEEVMEKEGERREVNIGDSRSTSSTRLALVLLSLHTRTGPETSRVSPREAISIPMRAGRAITAENQKTLVQENLSLSCCDVPWKRE